jgi:hypothetical protein
MYTAILFHLDVMLIWNGIIKLAAGYVQKCRNIKGKENDLYNTAASNCREPQISQIPLLS